MGDLDGIAAAKWGLAKIDLAQENYEAAFPRLVESFQAFQQLQRPDGIAIVGHSLGGLLLASGNRDQAKVILEISLAAAERIGATEITRSIRQLIARTQETQ